MADDPTDFWMVVSEPVKLEADAQVGDAVFMEQHFASGSRRHWVAIVTHRWVGDDGNVKLQFRDVRDDDVYATPEITIVIRPREKQ